MFIVRHGNLKRSSKEKWLGIKERMHSRSIVNGDKKIEDLQRIEETEKYAGIKLKGFPEKEQVLVQEKFHLLEDEQLSIEALIRELEIWLRAE